MALDLALCFAPKQVPLVLLCYCRNEGHQEFTWNLEISQTWEDLYLCVEALRATPAYNTL